MPKFRGVVYEPPADDLPHIAVVFHEDGSVLQAEAVPSYDAGEKLLATVMDKLADKPIIAPVRTD
jgi:hypothetical protein